jgi:DnaJ-class molecular chaperone
MKCPQCNGTGFTPDYGIVVIQCPHCGGSGDSENPRRIHNEFNPECDCDKCRDDAENRVDAERGN